MLLNDGNGERAVVYSFLATLFSHAPDGEELDVIREDLELKSRETEFAILEDFDRLFAGPDGALPPLESLNNREGGAAVVNRLANMYAEAGLTFDEEYELVVDHISLEFLFMSYLVKTGDLERQERFLQEHLVSWVPDYCGLVAEEAETDYYREIAALTRKFVEQEYDGFQ